MKFIIFSPSFDDKEGGPISLHLLCHHLNLAGETAMLWPSLPRFMVLRWQLRKMFYVARTVFPAWRRGFSTGPFPNPVTRKRADLDGAVVIYPEIVEGNPLRASRVVRWFLNKPGHFTGRTGFGGNDLMFFFQIAFDDPEFNPDPNNKLTLVWINELYRDEGHAERTGSCYLLRKGVGRALVHNVEDSILIDGLSHEEKAVVFNRTKYFYTYDQYTMYSLYAAICGCIPIIVPKPGMTKFDWAKKPEDRFGIAYGEEEIPWAIETRAALLQRLRDKQNEEDAMLASFIAKCRAHFEAVR